MADSHSPGVRRRRLSGALKQLRADSKLSAVEAGTRLKWSAAKLTRIERNEWKLPRRKEVEVMLDLYGVQGRERDHLLSLTEEARGRSDWRKYQDLFVGPLPEFEAEAVRIRSYEALAVPGLLQTPDYAAAVFRGGQVVAPAEIDRKVESRMARRQVLDMPNGPHLVTVIDEAALRKTIGSPEVMAAQLRFLVGMAAHYKVTVLVLADRMGAHPAIDGAFSLFDFPRPEPGIVSFTTATGPFYIEEQEQVNRFAVVFDQVQGLALGPEESVTLINHIADEPTR